MLKLAWVVLPLALYGAWLAVAVWRGRAPSRHVLNVQLSVWLMLYLLATAGLGIFWVANQQLPVFDWHYLFGYGTLALVTAHLWFNLPLVWRTLRHPRPGTRPIRQAWWVPLAGAAMLAAGYLLGAARVPPVPAIAQPDDAGAAIRAVVAFHEHSSLSRGRVLRGTGSLAWADAPPPFKQYPAMAVQPLGPRQRLDAGLSQALRAPLPRNGPAGAVRRPELAALLHAAAGITQRRAGQLLRAAPSSGGLFPSELYVLARRVDGLAPGIYHYDPQREALAALGALPAASGVPSAADADAAVVLTSVFQRTGYKYGERAWRYAVADAGHLLENLRVAAHAAGLHAALAARFDEARLAATLGIDGVREAVLAVMELRTAVQPPVPVFVPAAAGQDVPDATSAVQRATSLRLPDDAARGIALPRAEPAAMPVARVLGERRSKRRYTAQAVPLPVLVALLADVRQPAQLSGALGIHVVANRVTGLAAGVYRYTGGHTLVPVRHGAFGAAAQSAALAQQVIGDAAAVLVLSADRATVLADGARGYRHAFIEAGLAGERWLLGATARGLGACPVGAFYDDEAAALIGADPRRTWVLHFAALGVAAP